MKTRATNLAHKIMNRYHIIKEGIKNIKLLDSTDATNITNHLFDTTEKMIDHQELNLDQ